MNYKKLPVKIVFLILFCFLQVLVYSQEKTITGKVTSVSGEVLPGVSILIKGSSSGTVTNIDGDFSLLVPDDNAVLVFSFVGYSTIEQPVAGITTINVTLEEDLMALSEVVVVGYGVVKKSDLTGAMASLKEEDFNKAQGGTPEQLIQGRIAGVTITSNSGEPGAGSQITIRGASTIRSGAQPLYVIDGIPLDMQSSSPDDASSGGINSSATNPLAFLNANEIATIDVLKDASAAAIYGARGANGVVLVTTKKGQEGKNEMEYSGTFSVSNLPEKLDMLTADEWSAIRLDSLGTTDYDEGASTDWQDEIFRTAYSQSHNLSMSSGNSKSNYRASIGYLDQNGIIEKSNLRRYTGRLNLNQKTLNDKLLIETNLTASQTLEKRPPVGAGGYEGDLLLNALKANPTWPVYDENGDPFQSGSIAERSPSAMLAYHKDLTRTTRILAGLAGNLTIAEGLTYRINLGIDYTNANRFINQSQKLNYVQTTYGNGEINNKELLSWINEHTLNYTKTVGVHSISTLLGYSYQDYDNRGNNSRGGGFATDKILYTNNIDAGQKAYTSISSWADTYQMQSFFGRINYNLMEKYLLTATLRADGSSKFGENHKYGYFPSVAFAYRLSEEEFIRNLDVFSNLKLRLGWGQTGNSEIGTKNSRFLYSFTTSSKAIIGNEQVIGLVPNRTPNPDITWETTTSTNIGLDYGFFKGRLSGSVDLFKKLTTDILLPVPAKAGAPTSTIVQNIDSCKIINKGIEFSLNGVIIARNDLKWEMNASATILDNIVKELPATQYATGYASGQGLTGAYAQIITSDQPMNVFYGRKIDSISPSGDVFYLPNYRGADSLTYLGNPQPKFTWSINNTFTYKDFDLSLFIEGRHGNKIFNNTALLLEKSNLRQAQNSLQRYADDNINYDYSPTVSDRYMEDGSFVRISSATLGYTLNLKNNNYLSRVRVYVSGTNLFVFTDYTGFDPDVTSSTDMNDIRSFGIDISNYPKARTFLAGLNVTF